MDGIRAGRPKPPREYRRTWLLLIGPAGLLAVVGIVVTRGHPAAIVALLAVAVVTTAHFVQRRLDRA